jgi:hypothetical protein
VRCEIGQCETCSWLAGTAVRQASGEAGETHL